MNFTYQGIQFALYEHDTAYVGYQGRHFYFDPFKVPEGLPPADVIFITHDHFDHFSPEDIDKLATEATSLVVPESIETVVKQKVNLRLYSVEIGETYTLFDLEITPIPAYNVNKFKAPGEVFHPKAAGYVGYFVKFGEVGVYFAGDTDAIPEMQQLKGKVDVAFLPISGTYVMTMEEALEAAEMIGPKIIVPMHYGAIVGEPDMGRKFAQMVGDKYIVYPK